MSVLHVVYLYVPIFVERKIPHPFANKHSTKVPLNFNYPVQPAMRLLMLLPLNPSVTSAVAVGVFRDSRRTRNYRWSRDLAVAECKPDAIALNYIV